MSGFNSGLNNLATAFARRPMFAARNQLYQAEAQKNQAMVDEVGARTGLYGSQKNKADADTQAVLKKLEATEKLGNLTAPALRAFQAGKLDDPAIDAYVNAASVATDENKGDIVKAFRGLLGTTVAASGDTAKAAAIENPVSVANNAASVAERANRPVVAGNGSTLFTPAGQPLATAADTLAPGATRFAPSTNITNALTQVASGTALPPKSSGADQQQAELERQAKIETIKKGLDNGWSPEDVTRFINTGTTNAPSEVPPPQSSIMSAIQPALMARQPGDVPTVWNSAPEAAAPALPAPAAPPAAGKVRVQHPNGTFGFIPAEQVDDALKQGFKLAQ